MRAMTIGFLALLFTVVACKKSVEGESKRWTNANRKVDELAVLYPGFKTALEEQRQRATVAMDAAKAVSDEKQRIDKMDAANDMLTTGFVGQLRDADQTIKKIREKLVDVAGKAVDESDRLSAEQAADQAKRVVADVESMLKRGAADAASAAIVLRKVTEDLRAADMNLDRAAKIAQDKQRAKQGTQGPKAGQPGGQPPADQAAQTWTCEYCGTVNPKDNATCHNCGAAHTQK